MFLLPIDSLEPEMIKTSTSLDKVLPIGKRQCVFYIKVKKLLCARLRFGLSPKCLQCLAPCLMNVIFFLQQYKNNTMPFRNRNTPHRCSLHPQSKQAASGPVTEWDVFTVQIPHYPERNNWCVTTWCDLLLVPRCTHCNFSYGRKIYCSILENIMWYIGQYMSIYGMSYLYCMEIHGIIY